jgi:hypothetical protein
LKFEVSGVACHSEQRGIAVFIFFKSIPRPFGYAQGDRGWGSPQSRVTRWDETRETNETNETVFVGPIFRPAVGLRLDIGRPLRYFENTKISE